MLWSEEVRVITRMLTSCSAVCDTTELSLTVLPGALGIAPLWHVCGADPVRAAEALAMKMSLARFAAATCSNLFCVPRAMRAALPIISALVR